MNLFIYLHCLGVKTLSLPLKKFYTKNLVITYKLSTIEGFYYKERDFATILVIFGFCHSLGEITKEEKKEKTLLV